MKLTTSPLPLKVFGKLRAWVEASSTRDVDWVATGIDIVEII